MIGNGKCDGYPLNTKECGYDGGDCELYNELVNCTYPNLKDYTSNLIDRQQRRNLHIGYTIMPQAQTYLPCGNPFELVTENVTNSTIPKNVIGMVKIVLNSTKKWPDCEAKEPWKIGDGVCNVENNNKECGWDGMDCVDPKFPDCHVGNPVSLGNGFCDSIFNIKRVQVGWWRLLYQTVPRLPCSRYGFFSFQFSFPLW